MIFDERSKIADMAREECAIALAKMGGVPVDVDIELVYAIYETGFFTGATKVLEEAGAHVASHAQKIAELTRKVEELENAEGP